MEIQKGGQLLTGRGIFPEFLQGEELAGIEAPRRRN